MKALHTGFGKWAVADDNDEIIDAGPYTKDEAQRIALVQSEGSDLPNIPPPDYTGMTPAQRQRAYSEWLNQCMNAPLDAERRELVAVLSKRRDEDEVAIILRALDPALKAGKQAGRRERRQIAPGRPGVPLRPQGGAQVASH